MDFDDRWPDKPLNRNLFKSPSNPIQHMKQEIVCTSCKKRVTNKGGTTLFPCPACAKTEIVRCEDCRKIAAKYTCTECGFTGPN
jgi:Zn-ribbon RNA-binding protein